MIATLAGQEKRLVIPSHDSDVVTRVVAGETLLVPVRANIGDLDHVYLLDPMGSFIWALIDGERTVDQIVSEIVRDYEVDEETARKDLDAFIEDLKDAHLLTLGEKSR